MRRSAGRRIAKAAALTVAVCLIGPVTSAWAHAQLEGTVPAQGALLQATPKFVEFKFSEDVEANFGALRTFGPGGQRVDEGGVFHPRGEGNRIAVNLAAGSGTGAYTAVYRVISADGHPVSGGVVFYVGSRKTAPTESVAQLSKIPPTGTAVDATIGIARFLQFLAVALGAGAALFHLLVSRRALVGTADAGARRITAEGVVWLVRVAAAFGVIGAALGVWGQTALAGESGLGVALDWPAITDTIGTRLGTVLVVEALAWIAAAALVRPAVASAKRWAALALAAPIAFLVAAAALGGHATTEPPIWLFAAANVLHVAGISLWAGGVLVLWAISGRLLRALSVSAAGEASLRLLERFSPLALFAVAVVLLTGVIQSLINISDFAQLFSTPYGRAVLIKLVLFGLLVGAGVWQRRRGIPGLQGSGREVNADVRTVRRALLFEMGTVVAVLIATAALASYPPANGSVASGPVSQTQTAGPLEVQITVDPAAVGPNQIHIYLLDAKTGAQFTGSKGVAVFEKQAAQGVGPLTQTPQRAGPGHYIVPVTQLPVGGDWTVGVTVRVSAFDQYEADLKVPIR